MGYSTASVVRFNYSSPLCPTRCNMFSAATHPDVISMWGMRVQGEGYLANDPKPTDQAHRCGSKGTHSGKVAHDHCSGVLRHGWKTKVVFHNFLSA